ncbi:MAG: hypothetical protein GF398_02115 [Chitinivibrionales bacterium]|nr:hypothetical protein [Chitinivibrionales bacterium]
MDNHVQIKEIRQYREELIHKCRRSISENVAARLWIKRYAAQWRSQHPAIFRMPANRCTNEN